MTATTRAAVRQAVRLVPVEDRVLWDAVVASAAGSVGFHEWDVLDLVERLLGVRVLRLGLERDGGLLGVWPMPRAAGLVAPAVPFPFLGPIVPDADLPAAVDAFRLRQRQDRVLVASFDLPPSPVRTADAVTQPGVTSVLDTTVVVDLAHGSADALVAGYSRTHRRSLARSNAAGCTVRVAAPGELAALLPALLHESYGERGIPSPYPDGAGATIERWADGRDDVNVLTALVDGEPAGVLVMLAAGDTDLLWLGGCLRRFRDARPNVALHHAQLAESLRRGATAVDLVGAVDDGVRAFKLGFGGRAVPYVRAQSRLGPEPLWRAARRARALLR